MSDRRNVMRSAARGIVLLLGGAFLQRAVAQVPPAPLLHDSDSEAKLSGYVSASPSANRCSTCTRYSELPATPGTGICSKIPGRRVNAGGLCVKFYSPKK